MQKVIPDPAKTYQPRIVIHILWSKFLHRANLPYTIVLGITNIILLLEYRPEPLH